MSIPDHARVPAISWLALLALLATTCGTFLPLGAFNLVLGLTIAAVKTAIVLIVFMKLLKGPPLAWIYAGARLFWLMLDRARATSCRSPEVRRPKQPRL
jgi:caa(3)-type oxidase subunit IV